MSSTNTISDAVRISGLIAERKWVRMRIDDVDSKLSKRRRLAKGLQEEKKNLEADERNLDMQLVAQGIVPSVSSSLPWIIDGSKETPLIVIRPIKRSQLLLQLTKSTTKRISR